jgi:hypothetical protein
MRQERAYRKAQRELDKALNLTTKEMAVFFLLPNKIN